MEIRRAAESGRLVLAQRRRLVQGEDRWATPRTALRKKEISRHAVAFVGGVRKLEPREAVALIPVADLYVQRRQLRAVRQRPHRRLHPLQDLPPPDGPIGGRLHRLLPAVAIAKRQQRRASLYGRHDSKQDRQAQGRANEVCDDSHCLLQPIRQLV